MRSADDATIAIELISGGFAPIEGALDPVPSSVHSMAPVVGFVLLLWLAFIALPGGFERPPPTLNTQSSPFNSNSPPPSVLAQGEYSPVDAPFEPGIRPDRSSSTYLMVVPSFTGGLVVGAHELSILYVNTRGYPTLVNLGTGQRSELTLESHVQHYMFAIELGQVVTRDPINSGRELAGERAIDIEVQRPPSIQGGPDALENPSSPSFWFPRMAAVDSIIPIGASTSVATESLGDPAEWVSDGRWVVLPELAGVRIPAPADDATIWVVRQPVLPDPPDS